MIPRPSHVFISNVLNPIVEEVERQGEGSYESVLGLLDAWKDLRYYDSERAYKPLTVDALCRANLLAMMHRPDSTGALRRVPVTFANGGTAMPHGLVPRAFENLMEANAEGRLTPEEFYQELMYIHPWTDGNGRIGFLVYNLLQETYFDLVPAPHYRGV